MRSYNYSASWNRGGRHSAKPCNHNRANEFGRRRMGPKPTSVEKLQTNCALLSSTEEEIWLVTPVKFRYLPWLMFRSTKS